MSEQKYRMLNPDEVIMPCDECHAITNTNWFPIGGAAVGFQASHFGPSLKFRRPITDAVDVSKYGKVPIPDGWTLVGLDEVPPAETKVYGNCGGCLQGQWDWSTWYGNTKTVRELIAIHPRMVAVIRPSDEPPVEPLKIEVGKFYKTRCGYKARLLCTDAVTGDPKLVVLCLVMENGTEVCRFYTIQGTHQCSSELDLIAPWVQKMDVEWSALPAWATRTAVDECGKAYWFTVEPTRHATVWQPSSQDYGPIPEQYFKFTGDWKDSLTERPVK